MPVKHDFKFIKEFNSNVDLSLYMSTLPVTASYHGNKTNCTACDKNNKEKKHNMFTRYIDCVDTTCNISIEKLCEVKYKTKQCLLTSKIQLFRFNEHVETIVRQTKTRYGIVEQVKQIIDDIIQDKPRIKAFKLHYDLTTQYREQVIQMPSENQVRNYMRYKRSCHGDNNNVDEIIAYGNTRCLNDEINDDTLFTFGMRPGDGSDQSHFSIGFTSRRLLNRVKEGLIFHLDATYKIVKHGYPLIIFGTSDLDRRFFPIGFMFTSHETKQDYNHFMESFKKLVFDVLAYKFEPTYMITDASKAMAHSVNNSFENCVTLMCYFHVKYNIRKKKQLIPVDLYKGVHSDIRDLHYCTCQGSFNLQWRLTKSKWKRDTRLDEFVKYFEKQWINSKFSKWQVFHTPNGYASTNSPIESYNNKIKTQYTERQLTNMRPALETFEKVIEYESNSLKPYKKTVSITTKMEKLATALVNKEKLHLTTYNEFSYKHKNNAVSLISINTMSCTCKYFFDKAICKHLLAACIKTNTALPGFVMKKKFNIRNCKRRGKANDDSDKNVDDNEKDDIDNEVDQPQYGRPPLAALALLHQKEPPKRKRGRPAHGENQPQQGVKRLKLTQKIEKKLKPKKFQESSAIESRI